MSAVRMWQMRKGIGVIGTKIPVPSKPYNIVLSLLGHQWVDVDFEDHAGQILFHVPNDIKVVKTEKASAGEEVHVDASKRTFQLCLSSLTDDFKIYDEQNLIAQIKLFPEVISLQTN